MEFLRYNGKDREVITGVRGGKHMVIDEKKRYLTKEHKDQIFIREVADLAEKLANVVLEPRKRELTSEAEVADVEAVAREQVGEASEEESEETEEEDEG